MFDAQLVECARKVDAVDSFKPGSKATNPYRYGPRPRDENVAKLHLARLDDQMALRRCLVRGKGFHEWMIAQNPATQPGQTTNPRKLPEVDFLASGKDKLANTIVSQALPEDRP